MRLSLLAASVLLLGSSLVASADTVYTYTGQQLYYAGLPFSDNNFLRGEFTTATPLAPNTWTYNFNSTSFEFTDGTYTLSPVYYDGLHGSFFVDGTGQITDWNFTVSGDAPVYFSSTRHPGFPPSYYDADIYAYNSDFSGYSYAPGSFTTSGTPGAITPEPPGLLLLGTGLLGLFSALRRRLEACHGRTVHLSRRFRQAFATR